MGPGWAGGGFQQLRLPVPVGFQGAALLPYFVTGSAPGASGSAQLRGWFICYDTAAAAAVIAGWDGGSRLLNFHRYRMGFKMLRCCCVFRLVLRMIAMVLHSLGDGLRVLIQARRRRRLQGGLGDIPRRPSYRRQTSLQMVRCRCCLDVVLRTIAVVLHSFVDSLHVLTQQWRRQWLQGGLGAADCWTFTSTRQCASDALSLRFVHGSVHAVSGSAQLCGR